MLLRTIHNKGIQRSGARGKLRTVKPTGQGLACSTKYAMSAIKAKLLAKGISVGAMKCSSLFLNSYTSTSQAECLLTQAKIKLQAKSIVTGAMDCSLNFYKQLTGEFVTTVVATWDTMDENWETIDYNWENEWFNTY